MTMAKMLHEKLSAGRISEEEYTLMLSRDSALREADAEVEAAAQARAQAQAQAQEREQEGRKRRRKRTGDLTMKVASAVGFADHWIGVHCSFDVATSAFIYSSSSSSSRSKRGSEQRTVLVAGVEALPAKAGRRVGRFDVRGRGGGGEVVALAARSDRERDEWVRG